MEKIKESLLKNLVIILVLVVFSCLTLWLIESWIKYPLVIFGMCAIGMLYIIFNDYDVESIFKPRKDLGFILDVLLIASASALLAMNVWSVEFLAIIQLALALLVTSILSGYALLNTFGIVKYFSKLEVLVFSCIFSYILTGFATLTFLPVNQNMRSSLILVVFIVLGVTSAFKHRKNIINELPRSFSKNIDFLVILVVITFFLLSFTFMYPNFALLSGMDISRHYASSIIMGREPELQASLQYMLFFLHESSFLSLSNASLIPAQTALVTLNLILPLAFYVMTKSHLERFDSRLPSLATLFWVLFTNGLGGFAWLYFAELKLSTMGLSQLQLLTYTADKTYNGTFYGIFGLWYVPVTISFVMLMALIFLMSKTEISRPKYFALFSIMIASMYLTHVTEAVVFALFLAVYGVVSKNENLRVADSIKSSIIGFLLVVVIYYIFSLFSLRWTFTRPFQIALIIPILALLFSLAFRRFVGQKFSFIVTRFKSKPFLETLVILLFFAYIIAFLTWASVTDSFHTWQVSTIGLVPWFMYPLMLGLNGLFAIIALYYIVHGNRSYGAFMFFIAFMVFAFIAGKGVSEINLYLFTPGYWENRFVWFIKLSLAVLAPIPLLIFIDRLKRKFTSTNLKTIASVVVIGAIVFYGVPTTFLNLENWYMTSNNPVNLPSSEEMDAISSLKSILEKDSKAWVVTVTDTSANIATFAAPADMLGLRQLLYTEFNPEMAFVLLYRHPANTHPYLYIHNRDLDYLEKYSDCFLPQYLQTLPIAFNNSVATIYNASKPSFPQPNSDVVLVTPLLNITLQSQRYIPYYILSQNFCNYTQAYDLDDKLFRGKLVLSFDPPPGGILTTTFSDEFDKTLDAWSIKKGVWNIQNGELFGGESEKLGEGMLFPKVDQVQNFTASFKVKPINASTSQLNYVSLVYSWKDMNNYRLADILFSTNGYIYVLFRSFVDGVEIAQPEWPGVITDLKWDLGSEYNISVTVSGKLNQITVNGKTYLSVDMKNVGGLIGLRYYRFWLVSFDDLSIEVTRQAKLRSIDDYLSYLHSGGKIIVLNTYGYGFFKDELFKGSNSTINATKIDGQSSEIDLPAVVSVPILTLKDDVTPMSYYASSTEKAPFIVRKSFGEGELFYVNIDPIVKKLNEVEARIFYGTWGRLLEELELPKLDPTIKPLDVDAYVREIYLGKDVKIETESLLIPLKLDVEKVNVTSRDGFHGFNNIIGMEIESYLGLIISSNSTIIRNGKGFYAILNINSTFTIEPVTGVLDVDIETDQGDFAISDVSQISITPSDSIGLLARTPTVKAQEAEFVEFYTYGSLELTARTYGQNLRVDGTTEFKITLSDSYTILKDVKLGTQLQLDPPIVMFDELSTIPAAILWSLIMLPVFLSVLFLSTRQIRIVRYEQSKHLESNKKIKV